MIGTVLIVRPIVVARRVPSCMAYSVDQDFLTKMEPVTTFLQPGPSVTDRGIPSVAMVMPELYVKVRKMTRAGISPGLMEKDHLCVASNSHLKTLHAFGIQGTIECKDADDHDNDG